MTIKGKSILVIMAEHVLHMAERLIISEERLALAEARLAAIDCGDDAKASLLKAQAKFDAQQRERALAKSSRGAK